MRLASHDYFKTMRIPIRAGRDIAETDDGNAPPVVVLNETLATKLWPGLTLGETIGRRINALSPKRSEPHWMTVVGIVGNIHDGALGGAVAPEFYAPVAQAPSMIWPLIQRSLVVVVRAANEVGAVEAFTKPLARAVASVDPSLPLADARTMTAFLRGSLETARFNTLLLSTLGAIALLLAVIGVYGVVAYFVAQRTHEVGVRMALGATPAAIWQLVLRWGFTPSVVGVMAGVGLSLITSGVLREQLYGVTANDPATLGVVGMLLLAASMMATYVPARRAMRVSPMEALSGG
jgi:putative ABC transport system permease protein